MASILRKPLIKDAHKAALNGETTFVKLCQNSLERIKDIDHLNGFITITGEEALAKASQLDKSWAPGQSLKSALFGIPVSVKDNFCTKDVLTTCGSKMLATFRPPYNATVIEKLHAASSIIMGKTNMDEFAMGSSSTTSFYGPSANYWRRDTLKLDKKPHEVDPQMWYMAGGSSTGSAVSVASGACFASLGTDTGGSTRQPASLTGVVGFKPTYGLISRHGLIPLVHCMDVVSLLARSVGDIRIIFDSVIGQDENDLTSVDHTKLLRSPFSDNLLTSQRRTIRVGIPEDLLHNCNDLSSDVSNRFDEMLKLISQDETSDNNFDFKITKIKLNHANLATECYTIVSCAEIASNMSCYDGIKYGFSVDPREAIVKDKENEDHPKFDRELLFKMNRDLGFGSEVKKRILLGNYFLLSTNRDKYLTQALKLRRLISEEFDKAFDDSQIDVILMPSTPTTSVTYETWLQKQDDNKLFREDYFLIPSNLANLPSISVPCGLSKEGLPIGLHLMSRRFHDYDLLKLSEIFESMIFKQFN